MFRAELPRALRYAEALCSVGVQRGLIGPQETARIWHRHLLSSAALADLLPAAGTVGDLGSGAGLPGLVVAIVRPQLQVVLVEPMLRRCEFLQACVASLGLPHVEVLRARAEDLLGGRTFDVALARAVAPLHRLVPLALPLLRPGGRLLAVKGRGAAAELAAGQAVVRAAGARARLRTWQPTWAVEPIRVVEVQAPRADTAVARGHRGTRKRAGRGGRQGGHGEAGRPGLAERVDPLR